MLLICLNPCELPTEITVLEPIEVENYFSSSTQLFVAPDGKDTNPGTIDAPLATISAAARKVTDESGAIIWVRGGV